MGWPSSTPVGRRSRHITGTAKNRVARETSAMEWPPSAASISALRAASLARVQSFAGAAPSFGGALYNESLYAVPQAKTINASSRKGRQRKQRGRSS